MISYPDPKVQAVVNELTEQRNQALDMVAVLKGELTESNAAVSALAAQLDELKKQRDQAATN